MLRKILDSPWLYFGLAAILALFALAAIFRVGQPPRTPGGVAELDQLRERDDLNVVFILVDTLRADRMGSYGYERDTSPLMDFLGDTGVRFSHVQSQSSWTKSSMASLWTATYPRGTGVRRYPDAVPEEALLPAEVFKAAGFKTGGIFRNGWLHANFGFAQGFDLYVQPKPSQTPERVQRARSFDSPLVGTDLDATESAIEFIRSHARDRFFLYVHYMDVHQYLFDSDSSLFGTSFSDGYDNAIHWTDRNVSALVRALDDQDLLPRTVIAIASDHGEAFYEHKQEGHARNLYREVTETPLIMALPFRFEPGIVVEDTVQNIDLWPTLFDIVGLDWPEGDGRSLVPLIRRAAGASDDADGLSDRTSFAELDRTWGKDADSRPMVAVVDGDYRLIHHVSQPDAPELYDRSDDPLEARNIASKRPEVVAELQEKAAAYLERPDHWDVKTIELDEMRRGQLRALGYIDLEKAAKDTDKE